MRNGEKCINTIEIVENVLIHWRGEYQRATTKARNKKKTNKEAICHTVQSKP